MRRWWAIAGLIGLLGGLAVPSARAQETGLPDPSDVVVGVLRQVCDLQWIDGVCEATGYPDPQYRTGTDPSPGEPYALRIGAVHEHSGYSDGDPDTRPADYFTAARTGHNQADAGGDTGVIVDFLLSSEHSENEKLPITTAEVCIDTAGIPEALAALDLEGIVPPLRCPNLERPDHYRKWVETLRQAAEATEMTGEEHTGFTAMRGFEYTNDIWNHLGVYFGRNVVNAKLDGSYLLPEAFWSWLREPAERGGGSDALVVFNHPGGVPNLTPFNDGAFLGPLLQLLFRGNWDDYAYVPDVDPRVAGMEVNGGDDLTWYVRALTNGWHLGPVAAEDEHQREWSTSADGKTLMLTRGRSPRDYYWALQHHRTIALSADVVTGSPGQPAIHPSVLFWTGGASVDEPAAAPLGSQVVDAGPRSLELDATGLAPGSQAVLVGRDGGPPVSLGTAAADGTIRASHVVAAPPTGEGWWFVVICGADATDCGRDALHDVVTAPIWIRRP
jgi:hypothetical protein